MRGSRRTSIVLFSAVALAALVVALFVVVIAVTRDDYGCDREDVVERDEDCGYYVQQGTAWVWVLYPWVHPINGGKPGRGVRPTKPPGARTTPPAPAPARPADPARPGQQPARDPQRHNGALRPDQQTRPVQPAPPAKPVRIGGR